MKIKCSCEGQLLQMNYEDKPKAISPCISISISDLYGMKSVQPYKKPKLLGEVIIMNYKRNDLDRFFKAVRQFEKKHNALRAKRSKTTKKGRQ